MISCQQNWQLLFNVVSWVVKVAKVLSCTYCEDFASYHILTVLFSCRMFNFIFMGVELVIFFSPGPGIDFSSLIVIEGKICWDLYIDGLVVSSDGNLLDALGPVIKVQLT